MNLTNQTHTIGIEKNLVPVEIEAFILKVKLSMINSDFNAAEDILKTALHLATERKVTFLESRIITEQEQMKKTLIKWMDLIDENISLKE